MSVSLDPPLVAFAPSRASLTWRRMRRGARFGINVLGARHAADIRERARPAADRLAGLDVELTANGTPALGDALAFFECALEAEHVAGDHTLAIGRVVATHVRDGEAPLVFFAGGFHSVDEPKATSP